MRVTLSKAYAYHDISTFGNGEYVVNVLNEIMREHSQRVIANNISERDKIYLTTVADMKIHERAERCNTIGFLQK